MKGRIISLETNKKWVNVCRKCGKELNGLVVDYPREWLCSNCAEDRKSVLFCETGCKVVVKTLDAGTDWQQRVMRSLFKVGDVYTVDHVKVGGYYSEIALKEFPNEEFNTVFFERFV